jgi:hypothetical protein
MLRSSDDRDISRDIRQSLGRAVDELFTDINTELAKVTPKLSGTASRGWRYTTRYRLGYAGVLIENSVPYITRLDAGSSRKAPNGIVQPVLNKYIRRRNKI